MLWLKVLLTGGCVALAANPDAQDNTEKQRFTWATVLGSKPPQSASESMTVEAPSVNLVNDQNMKTYEYNDDEYVTDYDYAYVDDYNEEFFDNPDYIYVDTEDDNYLPPEVKEEASEVSQTADRRTLDFFYHLFNDQFRNGDERYGADESTTRRPSLIEAVFRTIDNHIVEDLQEWSTYTAQRDAQVANTQPPPPLPATPNVGVAASIQPVSPDNNILLVTDTKGNQNVVTINDIVSSLGRLDERTLTNLLLSPPAKERSSEIQYSPSSNVAVFETPTIPAQTPIVLGMQRRGQEGVQRPARHTGPIATPEQEEVYVVQDENGEVQFVTLEDIISSLAELDDPSLNALLFQDSSIPSVVNSTTTSTTVSQNTTQRQNDKPPTIPSAVLPSDTSSSEPSTPKKPTPSVTTDINGNIQVLAHPGSVTVDLNDLSWQTEETTETQPKEPPAPLFIGGSLVETDKNGDIYITPDPEKPFTLDIQNIIALAEQTENAARPDKVTPSKSTNNLLQEDEEKELEKEVNRGHEILSYLAGVENFLPAAILPDPIRSTIRNTGASHNRRDPAGVNTFRSSLLQAIGQQRTAPQPIVPQSVVQAVVQPVVQPVAQLTPQSSSEGIGATLSRLLSNLVGQSPSPQSLSVVPQTVEKTPEQEFIKLVVRQQAPNSADTHFGDVTIPLPHAIHFQRTSQPPQSIDAAPTQISPRVDEPSILNGLSPMVQRNLRLQANNVPRFIPPGARARIATQRSLTSATARSDSGPILRTDNKIPDTHNIKPSIRSNTESLIRSAVRSNASPLNTAPTKPLIGTPIRLDTRPTIMAADRSDNKPHIRMPVRKPVPPTTAPVTKKTTPSFIPALAGLPPKVLEFLMKQVPNSLIGSLTEDEVEHSDEEQEAESPSPFLSQRDRSSYASLPEYESPRDHGYGYESEVGYKGGSKNPLLDIYLLADLTKVHKIGDTNLSVKSPIIGDPAYFVKTRHGYGYHDHHH